MNRETAKFLAKHFKTGEEVAMFLTGLTRDFNADNYDVLKAFGDGELIARTLQLTRPDWHVSEELSFSACRESYRIKKGIHIVNDREVPAPLREKPVDGKYWACCEVGAIEYSWINSPADQKRFEIGNCFASEKDSQLNFNAMWRLEE